MGDVQQQIADGARPRLAKVGDRIEHGQVIPANVVRLRDTADDVWSRLDTEPVRWTYMDVDDPVPTYDADELRDRERWWPMTVVEVDPEPQPACYKCGQSSGRVVEVRAVEPNRFMHAYGSCESLGEVTERVAQTFGLEWPRPDAAQPVECPAHGAHPHDHNLCLDCPACLPVRARIAEIHQPVQPAESGPLVLTLPQVPAGATGLVFRQDPADPIRFTPVEGPLGWRMVDSAGTAHYWTLIDLIAHYGPVEVEMAPPREPRVWEQLDPGTDDLKVVECLGVRYTRGDDSLWHGDRTSRTWLQLRAMGEVREVLPP